MAGKSCKDRFCASAPAMTAASVAAGPAGNYSVFPPAPLDPASGDGAAVIRKAREDGFPFEKGEKRVKEFDAQTGSSPSHC
ncbi:MAG: hypothetical protein LBH85_09475, partial [Treponema sp.]|nr:hypothetical protein [Treponema sp.]